MANQGQAKTPGQKRLLANWGGSMVGVLVGGLGGDLVFGHTIQSPPLAALLGALLGAAIGFGVPDVVKLFLGHKAQ
jgi:CBS-domain-containing membrane protein